MLVHTVIVVFGLAVLSASAEDLLVDTEYGPIRGVLETNQNGIEFASFKGVPYAKQPLGELRFKELQPADVWEDIYNATTEGPSCPQEDIFYLSLMNRQSMAEDCIHANVYVPYSALPSNGNGCKLLPILVYIHGGGFGFGSGDSDIHGPEYLMNEDVILVTFNYRIGPFGFLSLNSSVIPGNNGLRDMLTLLRWVQNNAEAFGGNPDDVTIGGQSAGASNAHLLTLSQESVGLFNRAILASGTGTRPFFSSSPEYAATIATQFVTALGINSTDPEEIHAQLIEIPLEQIMNVTLTLLEQTGLVVFTPVIETEFEGIPTIIDDDPEVLELSGRGLHIPLIIGSTNAECETFRPRFEEIDIVALIEANKATMVPGNLLFSLNATRQAEVAEILYEKYLSAEPTLKKFVEYCSYAFFQYPSLKLAQWRAELGGAPVYMYSHEYEAERSVMGEAHNLTYVGSGHMEDQTYFLRTNHALAGTNLENNDAAMVTRMTNIVSNYVKRGRPTSRDERCFWPTVNSNTLYYQKIDNPYDYVISSLTAEEEELIQFWDSLRE